MDVKKEKMRHFDTETNDLWYLWCFSTDFQVMDMLLEGWG
jgi:hypothetical protein